MIHSCNTILNFHCSWNQEWRMKPFHYKQVEGRKYHQPCCTIYYWPAATWSAVIHYNTFCFVCHKYRLPGNTEISVRKLCYLFTQGSQALSHLCWLVHIFTNAPKGAIHQILQAEGKAHCWPLCSQSSGKCQWMSHLAPLCSHAKRFSSRRRLSFHVMA